jgi:hypothetical protein
LVRKRQCSSGHPYCECIDNYIFNLESRLERLANALEFYAAGTTYAGYAHDSAVIEDGGTTALRALYGNEELGGWRWSPAFGLIPPDGLPELDPSLLPQSDAENLDHHQTK